MKIMVSKYFLYTVQKPTTSLGHETINDIIKLSWCIMMCHYDYSRDFNAMYQFRS